MKASEHRSKRDAIEAALGWAFIKGLLIGVFAGALLGGAASGLAFLV